MTKEELIEEQEEEEEILDTNEAILKELRLLREGLVKPEPEPEPEAKKRRLRKLADDFIEFIMKYKVFGLAVAFIMAQYTGYLVQAVVDDIFLPLFTLIPGFEGSWADFTAGPFLIGHLVSTFITFVIVSFVVYLIVKIANKIGIDDEK